MALSVPNEGEEDMLDTLLAGDLVLRLFKNNFTPSNTSVYADFTWATFTGYAAITLTGGSWTTTPGAPSVGSYAQQTFTSSAGQTAETIYGYAITRGTSKVWVAELFSSAQTVTNNGDVVRVTPRITLKDEGD